MPPCSAAYIGNYLIFYINMIQQAGKYFLIQSQHQVIGLAVIASGPEVICRFRAGILR